MQQPIKKVYKYPHEVFEHISKTESFHDRVKLLQEYQSFAIRTILQFNFTPSLSLDLPAGAPPYTADEMPANYSLGRIDKQIKILGRLVLYSGQTSSVGLAKIQKETMFVRLLESISAQDALVILAMKEKELEKMFPMITKVLVMAAFPTLLS